MPGGRPRKQVQIGLLDKLIDDSELLDALDDWAQAKANADEPRAALVAATKHVKGLVERRELTEGEHRCGAYVIRIVKSDARHVEFDLVSKVRIGLKMSGAAASSDGDDDDEDDDE